MKKLVIATLVSLACMSVYANGNSGNNKVTTTNNTSYATSNSNSNSTATSGAISGSTATGGNSVSTATLTGGNSSSSAVLSGGNSTSSATLSGGNSTSNASGGQASSTAFGGAATGGNSTATSTGGTGGSATSSSTGGAGGIGMGGQGGQGGAGGIGQGGTGGTSIAAGGAGGTSTSAGGSAIANGGNAGSASAQVVVQTGTQTTQLDKEISAARDKAIVDAANSKIRNTPDVLGPALTSSNDTCMGSSSGGVATPGLGLSFGTTWVDTNCKMLKNSERLWNMGLKAAAVALLCTDEQIRESLEITGFACPTRPQKPDQSVMLRD